MTPKPAIGIEINSVMPCGCVFLVFTNEISVMLIACIVINFFCIISHLAGSKELGRFLVLKNVDKDVTARASIKIQGFANPRIMSPSLLANTICLIPPIEDIHDLLFYSIPTYDQVTNFIIFHLNFLVKE